ncbi:amidohydrolase [Asanoa ishikariensis]|uniref:L-fuconolactonase n=1 Tax=Asanoa ishikariensis TaxID=137265 RepID=A0A1H3LP04_9ACTN|nr:amidohydrolase family protein [Asanoa ishikariensis]GIF65574.1 amidohydrolase [Asanoa ishikariensis]SDY65575.1 L-fuconolactonase [Asanoa ishikariensis]
MIVDAHHHLWTAGADYTWLDEPGLEPINRTFTPADLTAELSAAGVERSVLVEGGRCDTAEAAVLLGHAAATPAIAGVVAWADPAAPDLASTLAGYRALPGGEFLVGIRSQVQGEDQDYLDRSDVRAGLAVIGAAGLVFDLVVRADQLPSAARVAAALPSVRFVLDHLGKPRIKAGGFAEWSAAIALVAANPNVTAKVSGLVTEADWQLWTVDDLRPYVAEALRLFGPERLMLGSDWPVCLLAGGYGAVRSALLDALGELPATERAAILGDTATRVYRLPA